jgi:hypothetical protein
MMASAILARDPSYREDDGAALSGAKARPSWGGSHVEGEEGCLIKGTTRVS